MVRSLRFWPTTHPDVAATKSLCQARSPAAGGSPPLLPLGQVSRSLLLSPKQGLAEGLFPCTGAVPCTNIRAHPQGCPSGSLCVLFSASTFPVTTDAHSSLYAPFSTAKLRSQVLSGALPIGKEATASLKVWAGPGSLSTHDLRCRRKPQGIG